MKKSLSARILSALLATVMVFLMLPLSAISVIAADVETITDYDDLGVLGRGYNLLGDEILDHDTLIGMSSIFNAAVVDYVTSTKNTSTALDFSYQYSKDIKSYFSERSSKLTAEIDVDAKIKMVSLEAKFAMNIEEKTSSSSNSDLEYAVLKATKKNATYSMDLRGSVLRTLWNESAINASFKSDVESIAIGNLKPEEFFEQYGTHILTGYSLGGEAIVTYSGESFSEAFSGSKFEEYSGELSVGVDKLAEIEGEITKADTENSNGNTSSTEYMTYGKAYGAGEALLGSFSSGGFSEERVNEFFGSITDKTNEVLLDRKVQFLPIWELLMASGEEDLINAGIELQSYFETTIAQQCEDFYADYIGDIYTPTTESTEWTKYSDLKIITTAEEFNAIRDDLGGNYILACDIDLSKYENWIPIGTVEAPFSGKLFGNYNTVSGLNIIESDDEYAGLFGYNSGAINNLRVKGAIAPTNCMPSYIGAIAAYNKGIVNNCFDDVLYDVDYTSYENLNLPVEKYVVEANKDYSIKDGLGIHLIGSEGTSYSNVNIVVEESDNVGPVYIVLENVSIVGNSSNGTIYNPTLRPVYIISKGTSNCIKGKSGDPPTAAINSPDSNIHIIGDATISLYGGNGSGGDSYSGKHPDQGKDGRKGGDGYDGECSVIASKLYIFSQEVFVFGGNGGNGGNGEGGNSFGFDFADGGNGGNGGDGEAAINLESAPEIYGGSRVTIVAGKGGDGGAPGKAGNGGDSGYWGYNGNDASLDGSVDSPKAEIYTGNKHYAMYEDTRSWESAKAQAESLGGYLATITSAEEQAIIDELQGYASLASYYIGAERVTKDTEENIWAWVTGEPFEYTNWYPNEPNNGHNNTEDYVGIFNNTPQWNDFPATDNHGYIVEYDILNSDVSDVHVLNNIVVGYNAVDGLLSKINDSSWLDICVKIEQVTKTEYFSGDTFDSDAIKVFIYGEDRPRGDYIADIDSSCSIIYNERVSYVRISLEGCERHIPIRVIRTVPEKIEFVEAKTEFVINTVFDVSDLCVRVIYNNGDKKYITADEYGLTYTSPSLEYPGTQKVYVYYDHDFINATPPKECVYDIYIRPKSPIDIKIMSTPLDVTCLQGENLKTEGLEVRILYNDGSKGDIIDNNELTFVIEPSLCEVGTSIVTVCYSTFSDEYTITVLPKDDFDHNWQSGIVTEEATHTSFGTMTYTCADCKITKTKDIPKLEGHSFDKWVSIGDEQHQSVCECGETLVRDHVWDTGTVNVEPTYTDTGLMTYTCVDCNATTTEVLPILEIPENAPYIVIDNANATVGGKVSVKIALRNNPGIASMNLQLEYDSSVLTLTDIEYNGEMGGMTQMPEGYGSPVTLNWFNGTANSYGDYVFATLTFEVADTATAGAVTSIRITYDPENVYNIDETNVAFFVEGGELTLIPYLPGDINSDGVVNNKDLTRLFQHLSRWDVEVNENALDVNGDGDVNNKDLTRLFQYLSKWDVEVH